MPELTSTDEMLTVFRDAVRQGGDSTDDIRAAGIDAVLKLVERDYMLTPKRVPPHVNVITDREGDAWQRTGAESWEFGEEGLEGSTAYLLQEYGPVTWDA